MDGLEGRRYFEKIEKIEAKSPFEISQEKFLQAHALNASLVRMFW